MPELLELPPELRLKIIDFVGFPQIFDLRQVCRNFRSLIDDRKPNPRLKDVSIFVPFDKIGFQCWHNSKSYRIKYPNSNREQFFKDLETILISQRATVIKRLYIANALRRVPGFYKKFEKFLEARPFPLKVEYLLMDVTNQNQLHSVLSKLEPKSLRHIHINGRRKRILDVSKVENLEQWKSAWELRVIYSKLSTSFSSLFHFSALYAELKTVTFEEFDALKKALLTSQNSGTHISIRYTELIGEEQWRQSLLGANIGEMETKWFSKFKNSTKGLCISWNPSHAHILFRIIDESRL